MVSLSHSGLELARFVGRLVTFRALIWTLSVFTLQRLIQMGAIYLHKACDASTNYKENIPLIP